MSDERHFKKAVRELEKNVEFAQSLESAAQESLIYGVGLIPMHGLAWNPYLKYPRNKECYCGSGKKFKKCCLETEALAIPKKGAEIAKPLIDRVRK